MLTWRRAENDLGVGYLTTIYQLLVVCTVPYTSWVDRDLRNLCDDLVRIGARQDWRTAVAARARSASNCQVFILSAPEAQAFRAIAKLAPTGSLGHGYHR